MKYATTAIAVVLLAAAAASCGVLKEGRGVEADAVIVEHAAPPQCAGVTDATKPTVWVATKEFLNGLGSDPQFKSAGAGEVRDLLAKCLSVSKDPWVRARQKDIVVAVTTPGAAQLFPATCDHEVLKAYQDGVDALGVYTATWLNRKKAEDVKVVWGRTRESHKLLCRLSGQSPAQGFDNPFDGSDPRSE